MKVLPYARLLRLPNVFTSFADIAMGLCVTAGLGAVSLDEAFFRRAAALLIASGCLYSAGMVWNDFFDLEEDKRDRPFRPLASGVISLRVGRLIGIGLVLVGWALAAATGGPGAIVGAALVIAILLYDARLKRTPFAPIAMATCRFLNVLLGLSLADLGSAPPILRIHLALTIGLYIVGVTWFARTEEKRSDPRVLIKAGLVMLLAAFLALASATRVPPGTSSDLLPYMMVGFGFWVGFPVVRAIRQPTPPNVQAGVKRSILGLVLLDAILASVFIGSAGLLIVCLLVPAILLGRWVYST